MLIPPVIHMNGTPPSRLLEQANEVRHHLMAALAAMKEVAPNARDYPSDFDDAVRHYGRNVEQVEEILRDFDKLAERACDAIR